MDRTAVRNPDDTIGNMIARLHRAYGDIIAIADHHGSATFADLDRQSAELAAGLLAAGMAKGAKVGILMPNRREFVVALLAVTRIGGVAVLMSTLARGPELAYMIRHGDLQMLLCFDRFINNDYAALLEDGMPTLAKARAGKRLMLPEAPFLQSIWMWGSAKPAWVSGGPDDLIKLGKDAGVSHDFVLAAQNEVVPADPVVIIYTSGSTADPKAVVHSQGALVREGRNHGALSGYRPGDKMVAVLPFFWVGGLCTVMFTAFSRGAGIICPDGPSMEATLDAMRRWKATHIQQWPGVFNKMLDNPEFVEMLKTMRPAFSTQLHVFGITTPELSANSLGMTETLGPHSMEPNEPLPENRAGSFGRGVSGFERVIKDPKTGEILPPNTQGELCLRGGTLMLGYHRKEREDVFDADGYYHTSDLCTLTEDGYLFFHGRQNEMVKIKGANVSPPEVEKAIRTVPGVKDVSVVSLTGPEGEDVLVAAIVRAEGANLSEDDLRAQLKAKVASYKVPHRFIFVEDREIPMTASSKVYKPGVKKMLEQKLAG
jgi:acyl-CoA synthetase (AMP-forming)/AMP-acid ligase II